MNHFLSLTVRMLLLTLLVGCARPASAPDSAALTPLPTTPPEWLTRPPTPPVANAMPPATDAAPPATDAAPPTAVANPAPVVWTISADTAVPADIQQVAQAVAAAHPDRWRWVDPDQPADVTLTVGAGTPLLRWVYALVAPFTTVADGISGDELAAGWQTGSNGLGTLLLPPQTAAVFAAQLGPTVAAPPADALAAALWQAQPAWSLLPFHQLTPDLKVLALDGVSPLDVGFEVAAYPLLVDVGAVGTETAVAAFAAAWDGPLTNYDPGKLTRVAMTGVTALVRATAAQMEVQGITWPGEEVASVMRAADIAHVSNEVSFTPDCPYPNPVGGTSFCSRDSYFDLLTFVGTDVVELTGNHVNDYGADNFAYTLDRYDAAGLATFGGGRTLAAAQEPALFDHNGNAIAFVGCNDFGPAGAWATAVRPGSRPCDETMAAQIGQLAASGHVVIATLQYAEFYHYEATAAQQADFRALIDAGAAAVSGSQGHHAQGFDLYAGGFIHYGLGNLFFDQMDWLGTRQTFVDIYTIYDGRLLSVQLWTGLIESYARPRLMTAAEREQALTAVFAASER